MGSIKKIVKPTNTKKSITSTKAIETKKVNNSNYDLKNILKSRFLKLKQPFLKWLDNFKLLTCNYDQVVISDLENLKNLIYSIERENVNFESRRSDYNILQKCFKSYALSNDKTVCVEIIKTMNLINEDFKTVSTNIQNRKIYLEKFIGSFVEFIKALELKNKVINESNLKLSGWSNKLSSVHEPFLSEFVLSLTLICSDNLSSLNEFKKSFDLFLKNLDKRETSVEKYANKLFKDLKDSTKNSNKLYEALIKKANLISENFEKFEKIYKSLNKIILKTKRSYRFYF